jgi:AAA domain
MPSSNDKLVLRLRDCQPEPVEWLWPGYVPAGKLTVIDGDPSRGKSLMTLDLAARLSTGRPWPDGQAAAVPAGVVLVGSEDGLRDTVLPRLLAAGADVDRFHVFAGRAGMRQRLPVFPEDTDLLQETIQENQARLAILDPFTAFLSAGACSLNDQIIRQALTPLAQVAHDTRAAIALVRHLNKGGRGQEALYRGRGSIAVVGAARAALLVGRSPYDPQHRILACTKTNLSVTPPSLGFEIHTHEQGQAVIRWTGAVELSADDLVLAPAEYGAMLRRAKAFLEEVLGNGPLRRTEIDEKARAAGVSERTLKRAKADLGVVSQEQSTDDHKCWYWSLPARSQPPHDSESWAVRHAHEMERAQEESRQFLEELVAQDKKRA